MTSEFTKRWDKNKGFTEMEAEFQKMKVDEAHGVSLPESKWNPAKIVPDATKIKGGYKVIISTKENSPI